MAMQNGSILVVRQRIIIQVYTDDVQWLIDLLMIHSKRKDNISYRQRLLGAKMHSEAQAKSL